MAAYLDEKSGLRALLAHLLPLILALAPLTQGMGLPRKLRPWVGALCLPWPVRPILFAPDPQPIPFRLPRTP